ncbi:MAG: hypothetical protein EGQ45_04450 [Clostridiales bacterium]|nr:hypothetical protein [Clostridiales bacterium]
MKRIFNGSGGRKTALILSLCLIFALAVGTTFALLKASTAPVENTFTAAESGTHIDEKLDGNQKKSIVVQNTGTAVSYVRVKLVMNWVDDTTGNIVSGDNLPTVVLNESDWFEKDGIYYYKMPVAPDGKTENLLKADSPITEPADKPAGCHLEVTVLAESIQAAPSKAVEGAWTAVKVDGDGNLAPAVPVPDVTP